MTSDSFWRCVPCEAVIRLAESESVPTSDALGPLWFLAAQREQAAFFETHRSHLIESLSQTVPLVAATGPLSDPRTVLRWEVSNRTRRFVIEASRTIGAPDPTAVTLDDPLHYRCLAGRLRVASAHIGVPVDEISRVIDEAIFPHVLPHARLRALTDTAVSAISDLDADRVEILYDVPTDPATSIARITDDDVESIIATVSRFLKPSEQPRLAARLRELHAADGLLCTVTRRYEVALDS